MKIILAILTAFAIIWTGQSSPLDAQQVFAGGDGSQNDPYRIENATQLNNVRDYLSAHFILINDIDLNTSPWNENEGWQPIGNSSTAFSGVFNGNGHSIKYLFINRPTASYQGLFALVKNAKIHALELKDVNLTTGYKTGALAGQIENSKIQHIRVSGTLSSSTNEVGGMVGYIIRSTVQQARTDVQVIGVNYVGSIVGNASITYFRHSSASGSVTGEKYVGGFSGYYNGSEASIADCVSYTDVTATGDSQRAIGGFLGYQQTGTLLHNISIGKVISSATTKGGFLGELYSGVEVRCIWDTSNSGVAESAGREGGVVGLTTAELKNPEHLADFDFKYIWSMNGPNAYPVIQNMQILDFETPPVPSLNGQGSQENPFVIQTAYDLQAIELFPTAHFILANDIDVAESVRWNYGLGFKPLHGESTNGYFEGTLDGKGFSIKNLHINRPEKNQIGLFERTKNAEITNLNVEDAYIAGGTNVGTLFGSSDANILSFVAVTGKVFALYSNAGGIGGLFSAGAVYESMFGGYVYASSTAGGAFGHVGMESLIRRLYTKGGVSWHGYATNVGSRGIRLGGLLGYYNNGSYHNISDAYSHAFVNGTAELGGLIGHIQTGLVSRSYSTGLVTGTDIETVGGLIGENDYGFIENCFWDVESSGQQQSAMSFGATGLPTSELKSLVPYKNWNFVSRWEIKNVNRYPSFKEVEPSKLPEATALGALSGNGSEENPYQIRSINDLLAVNSALDKSFILMQNLDLSETEVWYHGLGWQPLATPSNPFKGIFDGNNHTISGLFISRSEESNQGLFATIDAAKIEKLAIVSSNIEGNNAVGTLVGEAKNGSTIQNISISAIINGDANIGGLAGLLSGGELQFSEFVGSVQGHYQVGGLLGYNSGHVNECNAIGSVAFVLNSALSSAYGQEIGGLIGKMNGSMVENAFARVAVNGEDILGGLIGYIQTGSIYNSYAAGNMNAREATQFGGLIGKNYVGKIYHSYWDTERCGVTTSAAGDPRSHEEMMATDRNYTFGSWNFTDVWAFDSDENNDGLPYLIANQPIHYTLSLQAETGGNVSGANTYRKGEMVTAFAIPDEGKAFEYWMENGEIISTSPTLQFSLLANRNLTANFGVLTNIEQADEKPLQVNLRQNYPNPFNPTTTLVVELDQARSIQLMVYNIMGQRIFTLADGLFQSGIHQFNFNAANNLPSGIYLYRLQTNERVITRKMTLIK